ncbi:MAG: hypothetical protein ABIB46_01715 [bacterium]
MYMKKVSVFIEILDNFSSNKKIIESFKKIYGNDIAVIKENIKRYKKALKFFGKMYGYDRKVMIVRTPCRLNLMGMHIEQEGGSINSIATKEIIMVVEPREDSKVVVCDTSKKQNISQFDITKELPLKKIEKWKEWALKRLEKKIENKEIINEIEEIDYIKAPILCFQNKNKDKKFKGMNVVIERDISPFTIGINFFSSLLVASAFTISKINNLSISNEKLLEVCEEAEWYFGTQKRTGHYATIIFGKLNHVLHIDFNPLKIKKIPFENNYKIIVCNSFKQSKKSEIAKDVLSQKKATYKIGLMLIKKYFPEIANKCKYLKDINPAFLNNDEISIYKMLYAIPEIITRETLQNKISDQKNQLEELFKTHNNPKKYGYKVRQIMLYGVSECERSKIFAECLEKKQFEKLGKIINISHEGDRVLKNKRITNRKLDKIIKCLQDNDVQKKENNRLYNQSGGYEVSCKEVDEIVDISCSVKGVLGARLADAELNNCIIIFVKKEVVSNLIAEINNKYYKPNKLSLGIEDCIPIEGIGVLNI